MSITNTVQAAIASMTSDPSNTPVGASCTWIGDFPPNNIDPYSPYQPQIIPIPMKTLPYVAPNTNEFWPPPGWIGNSVITIGNTADPWKLTPKVDRIIAEIDVPGCKAENIELELTNGKLSIKAHRNNNGGYSSFETYIGPDYDPETADAECEDGVLTVTVMRFPQKIAKRIPVRKK